MVAIEFGLWRSVLSGSAAGLLIFGKRSFFDERGPTRS